MVRYCPDCKKSWEYSLKACPMCGKALEESSNDWKVKAVTKVLVPSPEHPATPYYSVLLEDKAGNRTLRKTSTVFQEGAEFSEKTEILPPMPEGFLKGKVVVVTGGSRGIGAAIVKSALQASAKVAFSYKESDENARAVESAGALAVKSDVSQEEQVKSFISQVEMKFGKIDVLVNNAGITSDAMFQNLTSDAWESVLKNNLTSAFYCSKAALAAMNDGGRIINISSIVGMDGNAGQANYAASKAGLIGLTKSLAKEVAARKITVNAIAPGFVETRMTQKIPESIQAQLKQKIPLGRFGKPEEIAAFVVFLASDWAGFATGNVFRVDGGYTL